ncbi:MAG: GntR family transcriptional regulator [Desulfobacterales bacterium]|jgi:GntR family transcriptional regulator|nr:GntR family transcriptional regulator [Desulfobacterales bacterium]
MDFKLNRKNQLPVHTQLKAQLVYLIQSGQLASGTQLPTVRQLAGFLRVNRNTVAKVFADMQREGLLSCEPGRGTFVSSTLLKSKTKVEHMNKLLEVVDDALEKAGRLGFSAEEVFLTLYARTQAAPVRTRPASRVSALFIECSRPELDLFSSELSKELSIQVDSILVEDFERTVKKDPASLKRYGLIITTFYHIREVQSLLEGSGMEVVALMVDTSLDTLMRLTALPDGTTVGVACTTKSGSENMKLSIQRAGLKHLQVITGCAEKKGSMEKMIAEASVIVCSSLVEDRLRALVPKTKELIVDNKRIDQAGIAMLRSRLLEMKPGGDSREISPEPARIP